MTTSTHSSSRSPKNSLYSRLTVLVAKLYKAEKLYSGIRRSYGSDTRSTLDSRQQSPQVGKLPFSDHQASYPLLVEHSNELRSSEWYKVHQDYRVRLNELLAEKDSASLAFRIENLKELFLSEFEDAEFDLYEAKGLAREAIEKEEFSHLLKISAEIIKRKAKLQAMKVIHDELEALQASPRAQYKKTESNLREEEIQSGGKVIPLMRMKQA